MDFRSYSRAMDVSVPGPSFRILNWTCYHRPILYRIDVNKDTLHGCVILCNVAPLRCLVAWSNPNRFVYSNFFWCAFGFIQQLVYIFMIICVALSFAHNGTCISAIYIDTYIPYLYLLMFIFEMVFSSDKSLFVLPYSTHLIVSPCNRYTIIPWASYQIRKIAGCACAGNVGNVFPRRRFQRKPLVSDPGMHHGTCVTHVPWCMSGSLTCGDGENVPGIPGACAPPILCIWQEAHCCPVFTILIHLLGRRRTVIPERRSVCRTLPCIQNNDHDR